MKNYSSNLFKSVLIKINFWSTCIDICLMKMAIYDNLRRKQYRVQYQPITEKDCGFNKSFYFYKKSLYEKHI